MQNDNFLLPNNQQTLNILQLKFSCTFCDLPMCIIQYIVDNFLDEMDVIALSQINKKCHRIKIKNLYHISESLMKNLTCDILKQYPHVEQLNISRSVNVHNINTLTNITKLSIGGNICKINYDGIKGLVNLKVLNVSENSYIHDLNCFKKMTKLYACGWVVASCTFIYIS